MRLRSAWRSRWEQHTFCTLSLSPSLTLIPLYGLAPADILVGQSIDQPMRQIDGEGRLVRFPLALLLLGHSMLELRLYFGQLELKIVDF